MRKVKLNKLQATGTTVGDVYFPQTKLLLPFDGANGATTTSDSSNSNHTITFVGNAQISTAQSKFGGSSLLLDGTGDYLSGTLNSSLGAGNWTIDCWVFLPNVTPDDCWKAIISIGNGHSTAGSISLYAPRHNSTVGSVVVVLNQVNPSLEGTTNINDSAWHHLALVKNGSTTSLYVDGTSEDSYSDSHTYSQTSLYVGTTPDCTSGGDFEGYIDDLRISQGIVRYTSNFTPPTIGNLTSAGDVNKQILINSTADGVAIGTGGINQARIAKVWANFSQSGTQEIRESYNVSSITDTGTGGSTINFSTAFSTADHAAVANGSVVSGLSMNYSSGVSSFTTTSVGVSRESSSGVPYDGSTMTLIVFGN